MPPCRGLHCPWAPLLTSSRSAPASGSLSHPIRLMTFLISLSDPATHLLRIHQWLPAAHKGQVQSSPISRPARFLVCLPTAPHKYLPSSGPAHSLLPGSAPLFAASVPSPLLVSLMRTAAFLPSPYLNLLTLQTPVQAPVLHDSFQVSSNSHHLSWL